MKEKEVVGKSTDIQDYYSTVTMKSRRHFAESVRGQKIEEHSRSGQSMRTILEITSATFSFCHKVCF